MEPVLPQPQLVAIGRSPAALALAALARRARLADARASTTEARSPATRPTRVITSLDLGDVDDRSFVVVATQGHYDEDALERALATPAIYVGLVASGKRAEAVLGYLRDRGVPRRRARARARARRPRSRAHRHRRDRRRDPRRDRAAAGRRRARRPARGQRRRPVASRGDRPGVRHDRRRRRRPVPHRRTKAARSTSARPRASSPSSRTRPASRRSAREPGPLLAR